MSLAQEQMPNYFVCNGANAPLANGSLIPALEILVDHYIKWVEKFIWDDIRSFCIKTSAVEQFTAYVDAWMPRSIWASNCRSWYKGGSEDGRVAALWPGSVNHVRAQASCSFLPKWFIANSFLVSSCNASRGHAGRITITHI